MSTQVNAPGKLYPAPMDLASENGLLLPHQPQELLLFSPPLAPVALLVYEPLLERFIQFDQFLSEKKLGFP